MSYFIGLLVAAAVAALGHGVGFDRSRNYYPIILIVSASYYTLFAALGGSREALWAEALAFVAFTVLAVLGFRWSRWLAVAGLLAHAFFDAIHGLFLATPGLPLGWPAFCLAFDVALAAYVAFASPIKFHVCPAATDRITQCVDF